MKKLNLKAIVSLVWLFVGVAAIIVGILIKPGINIYEGLSVANYEAFSIQFIYILKTVIIASGVIISAVASIGLAGAIVTADMEKLIYDDGAYDDFDEEGCGGNCASCSSECGQREE